MKSKKYDPERLAAKATKLARFIEAICSHDRTAKLPAVLEFLSVGTGRVDDTVMSPAGLLAGMVLDFEGQLCCHLLPAYCIIFCRVLYHFLPRIACAQQMIAEI